MTSNKGLLDRIFGRHGSGTLSAGASHLPAAFRMEVRPARRCSSCGQQGHNARTCLEKDERVGSVRPLDHSLQEAVSQDGFEQQGSADGSSQLHGLVHKHLGAPTASMSGSESEAQNVSQLPHISRERRRGTPWTEDEHRAFLAGLDKLGKGDWRGISKDFVTTRTPTQVASHAQKYFIRHNNQSKRKRRTSLFDLKANADTLETGSAEATSTTWPDRTHQGSSAVPGHGLNGQPLHSHALSQHGDRTAVPNATQSSGGAFPGHMWLPSEPDMALMQQYMAMAAGQMDPAALQMLQFQMAAAQGLQNMPRFPGFPPPGFAEQLMAVYAAQAAGFPPSCFPPYTSADQQDPGAAAQQQAATAAALANMYYSQQAQHQSAAHQSSAPKDQAAAAAAACALAQAAAYQGAIPTFPFSSSQAQQSLGPGQTSDKPAHQHAAPQTAAALQHQTAAAVEGVSDRQSSMPLLNARAAVVDDPAFGHGRLYKPQASHAKASVAPPSGKFGGAMNDSFQCASALSRNSSSESVLPPASRCFEAARGQASAMKRAEDVTAAAAANLV